MIQNANREYVVVCVTESIPENVRFSGMSLSLSLLFSIYTLGGWGDRTTTAPSTYQTKSQLISGPEAQSSLAAHMHSPKKQCTPQQPHRGCTAAKNSPDSMARARIGRKVHAHHSAVEAFRSVREPRIELLMAQRKEGNRKSNRKWCGLN